MLLVLTKHFLNKYSVYNIYLELWILLLTLLCLWFSSNENLELNIKLVACSVRFFIYTIKYWKDKMMFMAHIIGNFFLLIIPFFEFIPISVQTAMWCICLQLMENSLYLRFHEKLKETATNEKGNIIPFVVCNQKNV